MRDLILRRSPLTAILLVCVALLLLAVALVLAMQAHSGLLLATLTPNVMFPGH